MSGMIADHRRNPGRVVKTETFPKFPDLSVTIPDDQGCLRFPVFIGRESLGRSENSEIPDRLGFSRHMETRLNCSIQLLLNIRSNKILCNCT